MIDFETQSTNTIFSFKCADAETIHKLSHICINSYNNKNYEVVVYAYTLEIKQGEPSYFNKNDISQLLRYNIKIINNNKKFSNFSMCDWFYIDIIDSMEDSEIDYEDLKLSEFDINIINESDDKPTIYVDFDNACVKTILENNIELYYDYMDQNFSVYTDSPLTEEDFSSGNSIFDGESIWISKEDFDKYFNNKRIINGREFLVKI